ncbi:MAG: M24 family metallopeptidase [Planctomycetaceae bacterium]
MTVVPYPMSVPLSSGEIRVTDPQRGIEIEVKHRRIAEFLDTHQFDALLLQSPYNFSWFTTGGNSTRGVSRESVAALFITPEARVVISSNTDSGQLFDREIYGLGFQLKERPWHQSLQVLAEDICRGRNVAADASFADTENAAALLTELRQPLSAFEQQRMRDLGTDVAHAVEATCRNLQLGQSETEIAGQLAHRLLKHGIEPESLQVLADGQSHRYRHWSFGEDTVQRYCVLSAVGRRLGLCAGACRTVSFGEPSRDVRESHRLALMVLATASHFSQVDWPLAETWPKVQRIFEKFNGDEEWQFVEQGNVIGYHPSEVVIAPGSPFRLKSGTAIWWHPSVGPAMVGDTIIVTDKGHTVITPVEEWPKIRVEVKGVAYFLPDILPRE